jgi:hypothetical protein
MSSLYFEIAEQVVNKRFEHQYYAIHNISANHHLIQSAPLQLLYCSNRIWEETDNNIRFLKHRYNTPSILTEEELKEFVWIKLKSHIFKGKK